MSSNVPRPWRTSVTQTASPMKVLSAQSPFASQSVSFLSSLSYSGPGLIMLYPADVTCPFTPFFTLPPPCCLATYLLDCGRGIRLRRHVSQSFVLLKDRCIIDMLPSARDPRGFAVKMKTREGNMDWVFNNTPIFFLVRWIASSEPQIKEETDMRSPNREIPLSFPISSTRKSAIPKLTFPVPKIRPCSGTTLATTPSQSIR